ncbi:FAD:protein FMN transferase [Bacillus sp. BRMEA1]|nr:FAD:protein FMN transferase [Neobacillus endophyticus]
MNSTFEIRIDSKYEIPYDQLTILNSETERLEQIMSRFRESSELTFLNRNIHKWNSVSDVMSHVLNRTEEKWFEMKGTFDPRVLSDLVQLGYAGSKVPQAPSQDYLFEWNNLGQVKFSTPIDLGGIGKGYTADHLSNLIERQYKNDLFGYFINAGGDMVVNGTQEDGSPWNIGVEDPIHSENDLSMALRISGEKTAICTSSVWKNKWEHNNQSVHHLINPWSHQPYQGNIVSVIALGKTCVDAEVYAKCLFIQDEQKNIAIPFLPHISINNQKEIQYSTELTPKISWFYSGFSFSDR